MEMISVTNCPCCGALAQALPEGKWRHIESIHSVYDFIRELHVKTFGKNNNDLSMPEIFEQLLNRANNENIKRTLST